MSSSSASSQFFLLDMFGYPLDTSVVECVSAYNSHLRFLLSYGKKWSEGIRALEFDRTSSFAAVAEVESKVANSEIEVAKKKVWVLLEKQSICQKLKSVEDLRSYLIVQEERERNRPKEEKKGGRITPESAAAANNYSSDVTSSSSVIAVSCRRRKELYILAISSWLLEENFARSAFFFLKTLAEFPRDLYALKRAQVMLFLDGQHDRIVSPCEIAAVLSENADTAYFHGMMSFGYEQLAMTVKKSEEEEGKGGGGGKKTEKEGEMKKTSRMEIQKRKDMEELLLQKAMEAAEKGILLKKDDGWSHHALAHVLYAQGKLVEGLKRMSLLRKYWDSLSPFLGSHNWWHLSLFFIDMDRLNDAFYVYKKRIWGYWDVGSYEVQMGALGLLIKIWVRLVWEEEIKIGVKELLQLRLLKNCQNKEEEEVKQSLKKEAKRLEEAMAMAMNRRQRVTFDVLQKELIEILTIMKKKTTKTPTTTTTTEDNPISFCGIHTCGFFDALTVSALMCIRKKEEKTAKSYSKTTKEGGGDMTMTTKEGGGDMTMTTTEKETKRKEEEWEIHKVMLTANKICKDVEVILENVSDVKKERMKVWKDVCRGCLKWGNGDNEEGVRCLGINVFKFIKLYASHEQSDVLWEICLDCAWRCRRQKKEEEMTKTKKEEEKEEYEEAYGNIIEKKENKKLGCRFDKISVSQKIEILFLLKEIRKNVEEEEQEVWKSMKEFAERLRKAIDLQLNFATEEFTIFYELS